MSNSLLLEAIRSRTLYQNARLVKILRLIRALCCIRMACNGGGLQTVVAFMLGSPHSNRLQGYSVEIEILARRLKG